ncbi:hypothetical protein, partial [Amycolatopsis magusensis]|uniref:hypothetical protein n=1 Tax=Amycolatopsis magusensis TaxID=882444 RepID=UPI0024A97C0F|nr:hypothetical protein [Amycolatopsis magusensis]
LKLFLAIKRSSRPNEFYPVTNKSSITSSVLVAVKPGAVAYLKRLGSHHQMARSGFEVQKVTVEA